MNKSALFDALFTLKSNGERRLESLDQLTKDGKSVFIILSSLVGYNNTQTLEWMNLKKKFTKWQYYTVLKSWKESNGYMFEMTEESDMSSPSTRSVPISDRNFIHVQKQCGRHSQTG